MRRALAFAVMFASCRAAAGPAGAADPQAARATGFPGAYLGTFYHSLKDDPKYGSNLLDALDTHLQAVGIMTGPREVSDYLEQSAGGSDGVARLRAALGREPLDAVKASALLLADALFRPDQLRQLLDTLESMNRGVGRHAAELLRGARGAGDKRLLAALHAAGGRSDGTGETAYLEGGRLARLFDAESTDGPDGVVLLPFAPAPLPEDPGFGGGRRALDRTRPIRP